MTPIDTSRILDHVALLVEDLDRSLAALQEIDLEAESVNEYPGEGTREAYVGDTSCSGRLLLIEAISDGPYRRALLKRGPGLHHIALRCSNHQECAHALGQEYGWLLHHHTLESFTACNTIWLARPGMPLLVELMQGETRALQSLVTQMKLSILDVEQERLHALLPGMIDSQPAGGMQMCITGKTLDIIDLCHGELRVY